METWQKEGSDQRVENTMKSKEDTYLISPPGLTKTVKHKQASTKQLREKYLME